MLEKSLVEPGLLDLNELFLPVANKKSIALAVSGGVDSLALMLLVHRWKQTRAKTPEIFVYSLDHALRPEAGQEVAFVVETATRLGFTAQGLVWEHDPDPYPDPDLDLDLDHVSHAEARRARYSIIAAAMHKRNIDTLLTGHHRDDQGETIMMRLAHGSGLAGLAGIRPESELGQVNLFRPLLSLPQELLVKIVQSARLIPVVDPSNKDTKYERTRWRNALKDMAVLGLTHKTLYRFASRMRRAELALESVALSKFREHVLRDPFAGVSIQAKLLVDGDEETGIRMLSKMIDLASGRRGGGELAQLETLMSSLRSGNFKGRTMAGCVVQVRQDQVLVFRERSCINSNELLVMPNEKTVWDQRFIVFNALDKNISIVRASGVTRQKCKSLLGGKFAQPMMQIDAAPLVLSSDGEILALGTVCFEAGIDVQFFSEMKPTYRRR